MDKKKLLGSLLLVLTAVIWGTAFVFQRTGMEQIEPLTFSASRMTLAAAAIGIVSLFFKDSAPSYSEEIKKARRKNTVIGGILCGIFLAAGSIFQQIGLVYTTAGKAGFITALYMLIVPILNLIIFRKRSPFTVWIAVLMGIFGMYLLCMNGGFSLSQVFLFHFLVALFVNTGNKHGSFFVIVRKTIAVFLAQDLIGIERHGITQGLSLFEHTTMLVALVRSDFVQQQKFDTRNKAATYVMFRIVLTATRENGKKHGHGK